MQLYHPTQSTLILQGIHYTADAQGIITVPDASLNSGVWTQGFINARARLATCAEHRAATQAPPKNILPEKPNPAPAEPSIPTVKSK